MVAWVLAQGQDSPQRLVQALALAVRTGAGRPAFGHTLLEAAAQGRAFAAQPGPLGRRVRSMSPN